MKEIKNVIGCIEQAQPLVITPGMVYVHTNIQKLEPGEHMKMYHGETFRKCTVTMRYSTLRKSISR